MSVEVIVDEALDTEIVLDESPVIPMLSNATINGLNGDLIFQTVDNMSAERKAEQQNLKRKFIPVRLRDDISVCTVIKCSGSHDLEMTV